MTAERRVRGPASRAAVSEVRESTRGRGGEGRGRRLIAQTCYALRDPVGVLGKEGEAHVLRRGGAPDQQGGSPGRAFACEVRVSVTARCNAVQHMVRRCVMHELGGWRLGSWSTAASRASQGIWQYSQLATPAADCSRGVRVTSGGDVSEPSELWPVGPALSTLQGRAITAIRVQAFAFRRPDAVSVLPGVIRVGPGRRDVASSERRAALRERRRCL